MPFKSQSQRRKFYAMESRGEISPGTVKKWEDHTPKNKKLPEHVAKKGKGMSKKALFSGFDKRADQAAAALGQPGAAEPAEAAPAPGNIAGAPPPPEKMLKWNPAGGVDPRAPEEMAAAQAADLVTLPEGVEGANCGNCKFARMLDEKLGTGFCTHPELKQDMTNRMVCGRWDGPGTYRAWEAADPTAVPDPAIMGEAGAMQAGELPMDQAGAVDPVTGEPLPPDPAGAGGADPAQAGAAPGGAGAEPAAKEKKPAPKKDKGSDKGKKDGGQTVHVHVGGTEKKAFWAGFDQ